MSSQPKSGRKGRRGKKGKGQKEDDHDMGKYRGMWVRYERVLFQVFLNAKTRALSFELVRFIVLVTFIMSYVVLLDDVTGSYSVTHALNKEVLTQEFRASLTSGASGDYIDFYGIENTADYWNWVEEAVLPNVYVPSSSAWNNTDYNIGDYNHLLWGIRMRQARSKSPSNLEDCKVPSSIVDANVLTVDSCARRYSSESRDTVGFGGRTTTNRQLYIWSSANDNQGKIWSGSNLMEVYDADGYVVDLPLNRTFATNKVATMQCNPIDNVSGILLYDEELADRSVCAPFIDSQTRAIFLLIQVYNPNLNIFGRLETMVEFSVSGDVSAKVSHHTAALVPDDTSAVEASKRGVNWTLIVIMLLDFFWYVGTCRRQVCVAVGGISVWVLLDLTLFVLYGIHIVDTFKETFDYTKTEVMDALNRDSYSDLNSLFEQRQTIRVIFAVTLILMMVRLFKYLKYISGLEVVFKTLVRAGVDILWFMLLFVGILFAFVFGGYITFGHESEDHRTFEESLLTTIRWSHNDMNLDVFLAETGVPGIIYYMCSVLFFYFILVNMLIAILLTAWSIEKKLWLEKVEKSQTVQLLPDWQRSLRNLFVYIFCGCLLGKRNVWSDTASAVTNPLRTFRKIQRIYREHQVEIPPQEVMDRLMQWHARKQNTRIEFLDFIHIRNAMKGGQRNMRLVTDFQVRTIMALCENDPTRDAKYMFTTEEKNAEIKAKLEKQLNEGAQSAVKKNSSLNTLKQVIMAMGTIHKNQRLVWHDLGERLASVQDQTSQTMNRLQILSQRVDQIAPSDIYTGHGVANVHSKMDTPM